MKTYSVDLRERLLGAVDARPGGGEAAALFGVGPATIRRWRQRQRATGWVAPRPKSGRRPMISHTQDADLVAQVAAQPDATMAEHSDCWAATHGVQVSPATLCRRLQQLGLPLKKRPLSPASGIRPPARSGGQCTRRCIPRLASSSMRPARIRR